MSIYLLAPKTGRIKAAAEASPRVIILTDTSQAEQVPETVRRAADMISTEDLGVWRGEPLKGNANGAIVWMEGEQLWRGTSEDLRSAFFSSDPVSTSVPVHLPCLPETDLIGVQPRLVKAEAKTQKIVHGIRIVGVAKPSETARQAWKDCGEPWAELHLALLSEMTPGKGIEPLKELWQRKKTGPLFSSLVLRNLIVALLRDQKLEKAEELLKLGLQAYAGYADLEYLSAWLWIKCAKPSKAIAPLERAMKLSRGGYVGSGGETSYRASWLMGTICEQIGEQDRALSQFLAGVYQRPAFVPSVTAILRQRVTRFRAEQLHQPLCELVRREPIYLTAVFDFFLAHRVLGPAGRLLRTLPLSAELRETLESKLRVAECSVKPGPRKDTEKPGVAIEGSFLTLSGHARINQALGVRLLDEKFLDVALDPSEAGSAASLVLRQREKIKRGLLRSPSRLDLTIRHQWPPDFRAPECGELACILPWEHRAVPRAWVTEIERSVDELWVPSRFVQEAFVAGGVSRERVQVISNGFAPEIFHPKVSPWRPEGCRSCVFLFVGGTIRRKGVDLLLQAYGDAFSGEDDVTLIFKDTGASTFYRHNNLVPQIQRTSRRPETAPIVLITEEIDDDKLASLYRGCDALVLPYRAEGFGMPLMEAMACGRAVVTTAAGPALEFCAPDSAYLVSATEKLVTEPPPPFGQFTEEWTWFEPDLKELADVLRRIYENRTEAARKGEMAAARVARTHAWPKVMELYLDRIASLTGSAHNLVHA